MRYSELAQVLRGANPWWSRRRRASWVDDDPELVTRAAHEWVPASNGHRDALAGLAERPRPGTLTLVIGMRGVGKTTAVKDVVAHLVAEPSTDPRNIVLVPAELPGDGDPVRLAPDELRAVVRAPTRTGAPACDGPRVLVVDEVGTVAGWPQVLADARRRGDQVIATTSLLVPADLAALEQEVPADALTVQPLHPASLSELLPVHPDVAPGDVRAAYLRHGGLPRAVAEHRDLGDVSDAFVQRLATSLQADLCHGQDDCPLDVLLAAVCATTDRFVEPDHLARRLGRGVGEIALLLARLQAAQVLDPRRGLVDPLLHRLPSLLAPTRHEPPTAQHVATFSH